jgi:hypothetical protein
MGSSFPVLYGLTRGNSSWRTAYPKNYAQSSFVPIPELNRTDADVTVLLLNNRVAHTGEVTDERFKASAQIGRIARLPQAWVSVRTLSGVGCTEQLQFCNGDRCTQIGSLYYFSTLSPPELGFNPIQRATFELLFTIVRDSRLDVIIQFIKDKILLAKQLVYGTFGISSVVEPNHWQTEMENLHNISMASIQANAVAHAPLVTLKSNQDSTSITSSSLKPMRRAKSSPTTREFGAQTTHHSAC